MKALRRKQNGQPSGTRPADRRLGRSRVLLGLLACGLGGAAIVGCNGPRQVTIINRSDGAVKAAKVDDEGNEKAIVYMNGPSGGGLFLRDGESFVMGDARVTLDGSRMLVANAGGGTLTTQRLGAPERTLIGPGAVGYHRLDGEAITIDGVEVRVRR